MLFYYIEGKRDGRTPFFISKKPGKSSLFSTVPKIYPHIKRSRGDAFDKTSRLSVGQMTRVEDLPMSELPVALTMQPAAHLGMSA